MRLRFWFPFLFGVYNGMLKLVNTAFTNALPSIGNYRKGTAIFSGFSNDDKSSNLRVCSFSLDDASSDVGDCFTCCLHPKYLEDTADYEESMALDLVSRREALAIPGGRQQPPMCANS